MEHLLDRHQYDLVTPDGAITDLIHINESTAEATIFIQNISRRFVGFQIDLQSIFLILKAHSHK